MYRSSREWWRRKVGRRPVYQYRSLAKRIQDTVLVQENYFRVHSSHGYSKLRFGRRIWQISNQFPSNKNLIRARRLSWLFAVYNVKKISITNCVNSRASLMVMFCTYTHRNAVEIFNNDESLRSFRDKFYKATKYLILRFIFNCVIKTWLLLVVVIVL